VTSASDDIAARIDAYIAAAPAPFRASLERTRGLIKAAAPDAVEAFGYGIPGFKYLGRPLVYYGAWKTHCALYGVSPRLIEAISADLPGHDVSKGTIRFTPDRPLPDQLIAKLVAARIAENQATDAERKAKARSRRKTTA
jgi:uncharacterized protein YdhG (YjbR/CyaY superfamily)